MESNKKMSDQSPMNSGDFFNELKSKTGQRYAFVLGNGINYFFKDNAISWNGLLEEFLKKDIFKDFDIKDKDITSPEIANLIELLVDSHWDDENRIGNIRQELMLFLKEHLDSNRPKKCALLDAAWEKHHILTTNFDESIEKYIAYSTKKRTKRCMARASNDQEKINYNGYYPWHRFWGLADCPEESSPLDHPHAIWHIHGKLDSKSSQSVLFSLTRYVNAIKRVKQWKLPAGENWPGRNTWVNIFYNEPLIIVGLGLTNQEVFLRTLLIERKRYWRKLQNDGKEEPQSYYLVRKTSGDQKESDGRAFLRALGFKIVEFDDTEDLYNSINWIMR